jgi:hypothetical protein
MATLQYTKHLKATVFGRELCDADTAGARVQSSSGSDAALEIAEELVPSLHQ